MVLLPLTYLGPLQLFCRYFLPEEIRIEQFDNYQKQSYRNRCDIYGANGSLNLIIPVKHERGQRYKVRDTKIDYATDWRRLHWKGIVSAYNSSPFFEYYQDIFEPYYRKEFIFLVDFCMKLNDEVLKILHIQKKPELTKVFYPTLAYFRGLTGKAEVKLEIDLPTVHPKREDVDNWDCENILDLRSLIHPKIRIEDDKDFKIIEYTQVFSQKYGFVPNLSILDLVFNMGPESERVLNSCLLKK
jgi:hypothetical protein